MEAPAGAAGAASRIGLHYKCHTIDGPPHPRLIPLPNDDKMGPEANRKVANTELSYHELEDELLLILRLPQENCRLEDWANGVSFSR